MCCVTLNFGFYTAIHIVIFCSVFRGRVIPFSCLFFLGSLFFSFFFLFLFLFFFFFCFNNNFSFFLIMKKKKPQNGVILVSKRKELTEPNKILN